MNDDIARWLPSLPPFTGQELRITPLDRRATRLLVDTNTGRAVVNIYPDPVDASLLPGQRAADRAKAEAAALTLCAPLRLAPELLWEGTSPNATNTQVVIYRWVEGEPLAGRDVSATQLESYARSLRAIHTNEHHPKLLSPSPRNLDAWWSRTHDLYRDVQTEIQHKLPPAFDDAISRLVQAVAADAQAHKRFWSGVELVPVHGQPTGDHAIAREDHITFVNWDRFGLGDPAFDVAQAASWTYHLPSAPQIADFYLKWANDPMLNTRVEIYCRVLPFSRIIESLRAIDPASDTRAAEVTHNLRASMETYGRPPQVIEAVLAATRAWLAQIRSGEINPNA